jgi:hypothetical protein
MVEIRANYDRVAQLRELEAALGDLIVFLSANQVYLAHIEELEANRAECLRLLAEGFTQADLSGLSRAFRPFLHTFREWLPPTEPDGRGVPRTPLWFAPLEALHERARNVAFALGILGEY